MLRGNQILATLRRRNEIRRKLSPLNASLSQSKTHLEGIQHYEDVGPGDAEVHQDTAHPGETKDGQQHQDRLGGRPGKGQEEREETHTINAQLHSKPRPGEEDCIYTPKDISCY